jgi:hypothetical protein
MGEHWGQLQTMSQQLKLVFDKKVANGAKMSATHVGLSLGHVVDWCKKIYWNKKLCRYPQLQEDMVCVCTDIVDLQYSQSGWFQHLIESTKGDKKVPFTQYTMHSYGASFVFAVDIYEGGELTFQYPTCPDVEANYILEKGIVIGGFVVIMYADKFILDRDYPKGKRDKNNFWLKNERVVQQGKMEELDRQKITLNKEMAKQSFHLLEHWDSENSEGEKKTKVCYYYR